MAKTIRYREIIGCPKHGTTNGAVVTLKRSKNGVDERKPCFRCDTCKKAYLDPENGTMGDTKGKVNDYLVWNTIGPFMLPKNVYIYDKESEKGLCTCPGNIKKKTRVITHLLLKNGTTQSLPGTRVCSRCNKVFLTQEIYNKHFDFFEENNIAPNVTYFLLITKR